MKSIRRNFLIFLLVMPLFVVAQEPEYRYCFFDNSLMTGDYFFSNTYFSGGSKIAGSNCRLPVSRTLFHTPGNSLVLKYKNVKKGNWEAIIFHKELRGVDHFEKPGFLSFWMYSKNEIPAGEMPQVQIMRRDSSLTTAVALPKNITAQWQHVTIPVGQLIDNESGYPEKALAVVFSQQHETNNKTYTLFIDDIEFLPAETTGKVLQKPQIVSAIGYAKHIDLCWDKITDKSVRLVKIYRAENGEDYHAVGIQQPHMNRYADYTGVTGQSYSYRISLLNSNYGESALSGPVSAATRPMTDDELLTMVQEAAFKYYWEGAESNSGMAKEDIPGRNNIIAAGASGFGIMALIAGTERQFITREESVDRFLKILDFLGKAETFHGAFPHFIDGNSGMPELFFSRRDNGADLVETAFLVQGLLAARQYFQGDNEKEKLIRDKITAIWENVEWDWFRRFPDGKVLFWHWSPDQGWVINHRLIGWNETMVVYLLAIASPTHAIPSYMYYTGWAVNDSIARKYRSDWGGTTEGDNYTNGNTYFGIKLDVGVSNGGPLFFTHYSYLGYDPHYLTDKYTNYFTNNRNIAQINYRYCLQNPNHFKGYGDGAWGLTASDGPFDYSADEPVQLRDYGKIAPTGAISSFPYTPEESMKALKNFYLRYGYFLWGEYGFRDAFDLTHNWCSDIFMGLNQAPMVVMIENYRTGLLWKLFMQIPDIQNGLKKLGFNNPGFENKSENQ
jgi:hypothetical protein